ncbi:hypothetical protein MJO29_016654 [Puccinia striiformis f. sp. tritici]|uniref:Secreted protein n=2 Tax=Puccinia striiformis TaxID=27350 RepID=A0A0L0VG31_9BASI|nr:hypothetical protein MJO29_016654 [Puccinia striiformis f. sp. tritici]KAI9600985.1 hypothetical protein H4Q26_000779 [Puccinia striiformis f. sp. tritici PST-130]KNE98156.1 hypothetical protein PSTG_08620 [Puccinia striiformis f. sp. tritici PST-78]POV98338.1 hypothetical protein PSHT_14083 [Puccinia striiformis]
MLLVLTIIALIAFPSGLLASSIQVCTSYYIPSVTLNPGDIYCQTADDKNFKCPSNSCGVAEDHYFLNCARFLAKGKTTPYKYTVHYTKFIANDAGGYLDATGVSGEVLRCPTGPAHPHNQIRPRCTSCDPRIG